MPSLNVQAKAFGCPDLIPLASEPTAAHLDYLDLSPGRAKPRLLPDAVAEFQGRPVMYLLDGGIQGGRQQLTAEAILGLQQLLANRSEPACLAVIRPGSLDVYPINLDRGTLKKFNAPKTIRADASEAPTLFQALAAGTLALEGQPREADFVFHEIHNLLARASEDLTDKLRPLEVLSVTGRALFFRFLLDRRIILESECAEICPKATDLRDVFSNAEKAAATSCWLDETFNGDLLPLVSDLPAEASANARLAAYLKFYRRADAATQNHVFLHLEAVLRGWKSLGRSSFQPRLPRIDWDDLNFAHIPIGVLSQVYETFSRQWDPEHADKTSVYYTPKNIARCLVEEAFAGLKDPAEAHVLDPACGAGIFLVLAFRRLIHARWRKDGQRPDTRAIQRTLYSQIRGFDVSESALRLAALALYITAIEVNGSPRPPKSLKFPRPLKDHVLLNFGRQSGSHRGFVLGSLGPDVPQRFNGTFDVIVTNPPWSRLRASHKVHEDAEAERARLEELNREFTTITRRGLETRRLEAIAVDYTNPDNNPDLPFVWRAAEWAKPGGIIAMALPGRILFKQSEQGKAARAALLQGLAVTGIINGSNLPETAVWPKMKQPFILFFARNAVAVPNHHFYFATPVRERKLNDLGLFRIDYQAAEPVAVQVVIEKPWLLKALANGTSLDVEVMNSLTTPGWTSLGWFWRESGLYSGMGYILSPGLAQSPADHLINLLDFEQPETGFHIDYKKLATWQENHRRKTAHMPRHERLYQQPLLIIPQSPGERRDSPKSYLSTAKPICFSQSYYGFSAAGHPHGDVLVSLLYLITHSLLFNYFCLMVSSRLGAERRTFIKVDLEVFPFPDPASLTSTQKRSILSLAEALETHSDKPWDAIDSFVFELYGLDDDDTIVVRDTLTVGAPYQSVRGPAEQPPSGTEANSFCSFLEDMIQPSFEVVGQQVLVEQLPAVKGQWDSPWRFVSVALKSDKLPAPDELIVSLMEEANRAAASRVVMRVPNGGLLIGILNQRRFWTQSRARLCGLHILRQCLDAFPLKMKS